MLGPEKLGAFDLMVLLALIRLHDEAYGVSIARTIEDSTGQSVALATVYVTLGRLEKKGLIASRMGEPTAERGGRRRKHFAMTPAGARALKSAYRDYTEMAAGLERRLKRL